MKSCKCCGAQVAIIEPKSWVTPLFYLLIFNCVCGSTLAVTLWELEE